mmetsp:Transcript_21439/g.31059  ORF Transcript_21439/g.31059 Transcript_21439/m.31059 type:complete len:108 (-) Transcript_21439:1323-1646(-)
MWDQKNFCIKVKEEKKDNWFVEIKNQNRFIKKLAVKCVQELKRNVYSFFQYIFQYTSLYTTSNDFPIYVFLVSIELINASVEWCMMHIEKKEAMTTTSLVKMCPVTQ